MSDWEPKWVLLAILIAFLSGFGYRSVQQMDRNAFVRDSLIVDRIMWDLTETRRGVDSLNRQLEHYRCYAPPADE